MKEDIRGPCLNLSTGVIDLGRTVPTFRTEIERVVSRWEKFGDALRREERPYLERVIAKARHHSSASTYAALINPVEGMMLSIMIEQERELDLLKRKYHF